MLLVLMYLLLSSVHCPNSARSLTLLSSHSVLINFFHILHTDIVVRCFLGQLKSVTRLEVVSVLVAYF